jgi:hypothetical protein
MLHFKSLFRLAKWEGKHEDASQETCQFHHLKRLSGKEPLDYETTTLYFICFGYWQL